MTSIRLPWSRHGRDTNAATAAAAFGLGDVLQKGFGVELSEALPEEDALEPIQLGADAEVHIPLKRLLERYEKIS